MHDAMKEALKGKMGEVKHGGIKISISTDTDPHDVQSSEHGTTKPMPNMHEPKNEQDDQYGKPQELAPSLQGHGGDAIPSESPEEEDMEEKMHPGMHMEILKAIGDRDHAGRGPKSLADRAAQGANAKIKGMKK